MKSSQNTTKSYPEWSMSMTTYSNMWKWRIHRIDIDLRQSLIKWPLYRSSQIFSTAQQMALSTGLSFTFPSNCIFFKKSSMYGWKMTSYPTSILWTSSWSLMKLIRPLEDLMEGLTLLIADPPTSLNQSKNNCACMTQRRCW